MSPPWLSNPKEKRPEAIKLGHFREIEHTYNPDAGPVPPCAAAKPAIIVYGKRVGATLNVCTDTTSIRHGFRSTTYTVFQSTRPSLQIAPCAPSVPRDTFDVNFAAGCCTIVLSP